MRLFEAALDIVSLPKDVVCDVLDTVCGEDANNTRRRVQQIDDDLED